MNGTLESRSETVMDKKPEGFPTATLAGGCFWCLESEMRSIDGVLYTRVGYAGGKTDNPDYKNVSGGNTGHAEAVEITYDSDKISYSEILEYFLTKAHDPTQLNRQGVDVGTQYRSAIFYHDDEQKRLAQEMVDKVNSSGLYKDKIVTEIAPASTFWDAEDYHQQYYEKYEQETGNIHPRVIYKKMNRK